MSFVEDNRTWILPLLGLGAAAVVWFNVRTFNQAPTPVQEAQPAVALAPVAPAAPEAPTAPSSNEALWDDLRPVAFVPVDLEARSVLEQRALSSLRPEAFADPAGPIVIHPSAEPARDPRRVPGLQDRTAAPSPQPDFLIEGPGGTSAWFDGQGYRTGQPLKGRPFRVQGIRIQPTPKVTLEGTSGAEVRQSRPAPIPEQP